MQSELNEIDWQALGGQLLDYSRRPLVILDPTGRVERANGAFLQLLHEGTRTQQAHFRDEWLQPAARAGFDDAVVKAREGARPRVTLSMVNTAFPVDLVMELTRIGTRGSRAIVAVTLEVIPRGPELPTATAAGHTYEVSTEENGAPGHILRMVSAKPPLTPRSTGRKPCWAELYGRTSECTNCSVRKLTGADTAVSVETGEAPVYSALVRYARRREDGTVTVTVVPIEDATYSALVMTRLDHLAGVARLNPRERELLKLLLLGRSMSDIATVTGITTRTAKYRQQKLFAKLGAESRVDLFRLML